MMKNTRIIAALFFSVLTGCSSFNDKDVVVPAELPSKRVVSLESLAKDAVEVQRELAELRQSFAPTRHETVNVIPIELKRTISKGRFAGPASIIVSDLAREAGYSFQVVGHVRPVIVTVKWDKEISIMDAFLDIGVSLGVTADIEVDPNHGKVTLIYD